MVSIVEFVSTDFSGLPALQLLGLGRALKRSLSARIRTCRAAGAAAAAAAEIAKQQAYYQPRQTHTQV